MTAKDTLDQTASENRSTAQSTERTTEPWVSVEEIAAHLNVKPDTVYKWIERKKGFPAHKVGRLWRCKISAVDEWVVSGSELQPDLSVAKSGDAREED